MDPQVARRIARRNHRGQHTRFGEPVVEHLRRVAAAVPPEIRAIAWLHDLLELTPLDVMQLRPRGLTATEDRALQLLTREAGEPYDAHVRRIVHAPGQAGWIARTVKLADLDDHLAHGRMPPDAPAYAWARHCVLEQVELELSTAVAHGL